MEIPRDHVGWWYPFAIFLPQTTMVVQGRDGSSGGAGGVRTPSLLNLSIWGGGTPSAPPQIFGNFS